MMKSENPYAEAINPDMVEIRIKGHRFQISAQEASMYGAHIASASQQCRMMLDSGCIPEQIPYASSLKEPKKLADSWVKEVKANHDGEGKRFWIPAIYIISGHYDLALSYCTSFIVDCKKRDLRFQDPTFLLSFLIVSFKQNKDVSPGSRNESIIHELHITNPYILDLVVGNDVEPLDGRIHFSNITSFGWAKSLPPWLYALVSFDLKEAIKNYQLTLTYQSFVSTQAILNKNCITREGNECDELRSFEARHQNL